jgi:hypothetical protein
VTDSVVLLGGMMALFVGTSVWLTWLTHTRFGSFGGRVRGFLGWVDRSSGRAQAGRVAGFIPRRCNKRSAASRPLVTAPSTIGAAR